LHFSESYDFSSQVYFGTTDGQDELKKKMFPNIENEKRAAQGTKIAKKIFVSAKECTITLVIKPTEERGI